MPSQAVNVKLFQDFLQFIIVRVFTLTLTTLKKAQVIRLSFYLFL